MRMKSLVEQVLDSAHFERQSQRIDPNRRNPVVAAKPTRMERDARLRTLHAQGRTDAQLATALGMTHPGAKYARERLLLPQNPSERRMKRVRP